MTVVLVIAVCLLPGCTGSDGRGITLAPAPKRLPEETAAVSPGPPSTETTHLPAQVVVRDVEKAWGQCVAALLSGQAPQRMSLWSRNPDVTWVEGDLQYVCDRFEDLGVTASGDEATGRAVLHVVETQWSTGRSSVEDRDYAYVVELRREADGGWRVVQAPDCVFIVQ